VLCIWDNASYVEYNNQSRKFNMPISPILNAEIRVLTLFNLDSAMEGIKVHQTADADTLDAIKRLYEKGLVTQADGGYLTDLGIHCAEHLQTALRILNTSAQDL